jgi:hypothetical protein
MVAFTKMDFYIYGDIFTTSERSLHKLTPALNKDL